MKNDDDTDYYVSITDVVPFANQYSNIYGWEYYVYGQSRYIKSTLNSNSMGSPSGRVWEENGGSCPIYGQPYDGFKDANLTFNTSGSYSATWSNIKVPAKSTVMQTVYIKIPGDNTKSSEDPSNNAFQYLVSAYRYYSSSNKLVSVLSVNRGGSFTTKPYPSNISDFMSTRISIEHTVAPFMYISTGVIGKSNHSSSGYEGSAAYPKDSQTAKDIDNLKKFELNDNQYIFNYVFIYNDSDEAISLSDYNINLFIPYGFEFEGINGMSLTHYYLRTSGMSPYPFYGINGSSSSFSCTNIGNGGVSASKDSQSEKGREIRVYSSARIERYSGAFFVYAVKVDSDKAKNAYISKDNRATFSVAISSARGYMMPQASIDVSVKNGRITGDGANDGFVAAYLAFNPGNGNSKVNVNGSNYPLNGDFADNAMFYNCSVSPSSRGWDYRSYNGNSPYIMYSNVSLYTEQRRLSVNVEKRVNLNIGSDNANDHTQNNDYSFGYWLPDGLHRTVDGIVSWHVKVENTGHYDKNATLTYGELNYGYLVDTVDNPYKLNSLVFSKIPYRYVDSKGESHYVELDLSATDSVGSSVDPDNSVKGKRFEVKFDSGNQVVISLGKIMIDGLGEQEIFVRVTRTPLSNGLAHGVDAPANSGATQYIIEFCEITGSGWSLKPELSWSGEGDYCGGSHDSERHKIEFDMLFETDDSILTNYNSFGLGVVGDYTDDRIDVSGNAEKRRMKDSHTSNAGAGSASQMSVDSGIMTVSTGGGTMPLAAENVSFIGDGPEKPADNETVIEYSDWTDTSYTDGYKKMEVIGSGEENSINNREDGDMKFENISNMSRIRTTLAVESILSEAENYDWFENLSIYDVFGVPNDSTVDNFGERSPYDIDFSTVKVYDNAGNTLVLGQDYDIYYTYGDYVYVEHHPISPVNTLHYAANPNLEYSDSEWILYDASMGGHISDPEKGAPHGIMIKLKGDSYSRITKDRRITKHESDDETLYDDNIGYYAIYVRFESDIVEGLPKTRGGEAIPYPNVLAYEADVHVKDTGRTKHIFEDTTAVNTTFEQEKGFRIEKAVEYDDINYSEKFKDQEFTVLIFRYLSGTYDAVAKLTLTPKSPATHEEIELIYAVPKASAITEENFFNSKGRYYIYEYGADAYSKKFVIEGENSNISGVPSMSASFKPVLEEENFVPGFDDGEMKEFLLGISSNLSGASFTPSVDSGADNFSIHLRLENTFDDTKLLITKIEQRKAAAAGEPVSEDVLIENEVTFNIFVSDDPQNEPLTFVKDDSGNYRLADASALNPTADIAFTGGKVSVTGLAPGKKYILVETKAPEGYKVLDSDKDGIEFFMGAEEDITVENAFDNSSIFGKLVLTKTDSLGNIIDKLPAVFNVYAADQVVADGSGVYKLKSDAVPLKFTLAKKIIEEEGKEPQEVSVYELSESGESDLSTENGVLRLDKLLLDDVSGSAEYYIVEKTAPFGYVLDTAVRKIEVSRNSINASLSVDNERLIGSLSLTKTDEAGNTIVSDEARFKIYRASDLVDGKPVSGTELHFNLKGDSYEYSTSGGVNELETVGGKLNITGLEGDKYFLYETKAPAGYKINADGLEVDIIKEETEIEVKNVTQTVKIKLTKNWKGSGRAYPMSGVTFALFEENDGKITNIAQAVTGSDGVLEFENIDWANKKYYLYEVPVNGYMLPGTVTYIADKSTPPTELFEKYSNQKLEDNQTKVSVFEIVFNSENMSKGSDGLWVYNLTLTNIRMGAVQNVFNSFAYKEIDNLLASEHYGLRPEHGYSFYFDTADYNNQGMNYVHALVAGDVVTYRLHIINKSDADYSKISIIDVMPAEDDTGVVNPDNRNSDFSVHNTKYPFNIYIINSDGTQTVIPDDKYTVSFSTKNGPFTNDDFNGVSEWDTVEFDKAAGRWESETLTSASGEYYKNFRIVFESSVSLAPDCELVVEYDGRIDSEAEPESDENVVKDKDNAKIAWNNFAYRYTASEIGKEAEIMTVASGIETLGSTATPEPLKVGVITMRTAAKIEAQKKLTYDEKAFKSGDDILSEPIDVEFKLKYAGFSAYASGGAMTVADPVPGEAPSVLFGADNIPIEFNGDVTISKSISPSNTEAVELFGKDDLIWFSKPGTYTFELSEIIPAASAKTENYDYKYDGAVYTITVNVSPEEFTKYSEDQSYYIGRDSTDAVVYSGGKAPVFENKLVGYGKLSIIKSVTANGLSDADKKEFTFKVTFKNGTDEADLSGVTAKIGSEDIEAPVSGVYTFSLKDGDKAEFTNIPAGYTYTVEEIKDDAYDTKVLKNGVAASQTQESTVLAAGEDEFEYTNAFKVHKLTVKKTVEGVPNGYTPDVFEFTVTLRNDRFRLTYNDNDGVITAEELSRGETADDCVITFTLSGGEEKVIAQIPDGTVYSVSEEENERYTGSGEVENQTITADSNKEIVNTFSAGKIKITKSVENLPENKELLKLAQKEFSFKVKFTKTDGGKGTVYNSEVSVSGATDKNGKTLKAGSDGYYRFVLKDGEYLEFDYIPAGFVCEVVEDDEAKQYIKELTVDNKPLSGTVEIESNKTIEFSAVNTYKSGKLEVKKTVSDLENGADPNDSFKFSVTVFTDGAKTEPLLIDLEPKVTDSYKPAAGEVRLPSDKVKFDSKTGEYTVNLRHGESLLFDFIPEGYTYTVTETKDVRYSQDYNRTASDGADAEKDIVETGAEKTVEVINKYNVGTFTLEKKVTGENKDYSDNLDEKQFEFTLTLTDMDKNPVEASFDCYLYEKGEEITDDYDGREVMKLEFRLSEDKSVSTASISLKDGQKIRVINIPENYSIEVSEKEELRYETVYKVNGKDGTKAVIVTNEDQKVTVENALDVGSVEIKKTVSGGVVDADGRYSDKFEFKVSLKLNGDTLEGEYDYLFNGVKVADKKISDGSVVELSDGDIIKIVGVPSETVVTVEETEHSGYTPKIDGTVSESEDIEVKKDTVESVEFVNDFDDGSLSLEKEIEVDYAKNLDSEQTFEFTLTLTNANYTFETVKDSSGKTEISNGTVSIRTTGHIEAGEAPCETEIPIALKNGEKVTVTGIPNGTDYTITEKEVFGYTGDGDKKGTVSTDDAVEITYKNRYEVGKLSVSKAVTENRDMAWTEPFEFVLNMTDRNGDKLRNQTYPYIKTLANGTEEKNTYTLGDTFELMDGETILFTDLPLGAKYTVTETEDTDHFTTYANGEAKASVEGTVAEKNNTYKAEFENELNRGSISISKYLGGTGGAKDIANNLSYNFILKVTTDWGEPLNGEYPYTKGSESGTVKFTDGVCETITLHHGEKIVITDIPALCEYTVEELDCSGYDVSINNEISYDGKTDGIVVKDAESRVRYDNYREALGSLTVSKRVTVGGSYSRIFWFEIFLTDSQGYLVPINGTYGDITFTNGHAYFPLSHGESKTAVNLPADIYYKVTETPDKAYLWNANGYEGMITDYGDAKAQFVNSLGYGDLAIKKTVEGKNPDTEREFVFTVNLYDEDGRVLGGQYSYSGSKSGFISSGGAITLKHGEIVVITGLPRGTSYTVSESLAEGYTSESTGTSGVIGDTVATASFVNTEDEKPEVPVESPSNTDDPEQIPDINVGFDDVPQTGDSGMLSIWLVLMALSFAGAFLTAGSLVRKKQ